MPGLAASLRVSGASHPSWQPPRLQTSLGRPQRAAPGLGVETCWGGGGESESERPEGGRRRGRKVCKGGSLHDSGQKPGSKRIQLLPDSLGSSDTKLNPLTLTLYPNDSFPS